MFSHWLTNCFKANRSRTSPRAPAPRDGVHALSGGDRTGGKLHRDRTRAAARWRTRSFRWRSPTVPADSDRSIVKIRELVLRLAHLNRVQSPIINRIRQDLAWQFPEVALVRWRTRPP
ncbi:MAG: hypothetical protein V7K40_23720 [Nostoc sp.]|uniref:hypothetical protein n=1 Tax=Nostoc sp. TaxID=1180 RepID=UPI002FFD0273